MDRIYADSENKYVKSTILYVRDIDEYAYLDEAFTQKIDKYTLYNLCLNGVLLRKDTEVFIPYSFSTPDDNCISIKYRNKSSNYSAFSEEYVPKVTG